MSDDKAVCISFCANGPEKAMNPSVLTSSNGKIEEQIGLFSLSKRLGSLVILREGKLWI